MNFWWCYDKFNMAEPIWRLYDDLLSDRERKCWMFLGVSIFSNICPQKIKNTQELCDQRFLEKGNFGFFFSIRTGLTECFIHEKKFFERLIYYRFFGAIFFNFFLSTRKKS